MGELQEYPFQQGKITHQKVIEENGLLFPMLLLPLDMSDEGNTLQSFLHTIETNRESINNHLKKVGALLFRGFPLKSASDFNEVMEAFGWEEKAYMGAASRTRVEGRVFTANEAPFHQPIKFHHEMCTHRAEMGELQDCPFQQGKITHQKVISENGLLFPMVLLPLDVSDEGNTLQSFLHTIETNRGWINNHLRQVGALLFRGFPLKSASDFNEVMEAFGWEEKTYMGAASRTRVEGRVFTANEAPLHKPIKFHHEMAMFEDFPTKLAFYCEIAPPDGGETAVLLSHKITERMEEKYPEFVSKLEKEGSVYQANFPAEDDPNNFLRGWQTLYNTKDKEEAEKKAKDAGLKISKVSWDGNTMLLELEPLTSIRTVDGDKKAFFNLLPRNDLGPGPGPLLGDGSVIPKDVIESCQQIAEEEAVDVKWEVGDVVVLDNRFVMHARRPSKPPRRILAAFCK